MSYKLLTTTVFRQFGKYEIDNMVNKGRYLQDIWQGRWDIWKEWHMTMNTLQDMIFYVECGGSNVWSTIIDVNRQYL